MAKSTFSATTSVLTNMVLVCLALVLVAMMVFMTMRLRASSDDASPQARELLGMTYAKDVAARCPAAAASARRALADGRISIDEMGLIDRQVERARDVDIDACPVKPKHLDRSGAMDIPEM